MAIIITAEELALLERILDITRTALTSGASGAREIAPVMPEFPPVTDPPTTTAEDGVMLYAVSTIKVLPEVIATTIDAGLAGITLQSPGGARFRITISNIGVIVITPL